MTKGRKLLGEERRTYILNLLKNANNTITGGELASLTNVSRQVIVSDITLLKAREEPIIATSQGYIYMEQTPQVTMLERTITSSHPPDKTEEELLILVDNGVTVKDVKIEHPVYGDLTASIMVQNRAEVQQFMDKITSTKASYLSELTGGYHLHTIIAPSEQLLDNAEEALRKANFLIEE